MTALGWQLYDRTHFEDGCAKYVLSFLKENNKLEKKILRTLWTSQHSGLIFSAHSAVGGRKSRTHKCGLGGRKVQDLLLAIPFTRCISWDKFLSISVSWLPYV